MDKALYEYIAATYAPETEAQRITRTTTEERGLPDISVSPQEGKLLQVLLRMIHAKHVLEIGTLAGYSALWIADALGSDGHLISLEASEKHAEVARDNVKNAGLEDRVEIRVGKAADLLPQMGDEGPFDAVFIDADKVSYPDYLVWAKKLVRSGGLIVGDNTLAWGTVINESDKGDDVEGIRRFNRMVSEDPDLFGVIIPTEGNDGMTIVLVGGD